MISIDGHTFTVCFWGDAPEPRKVVWIGEENNGPVHHWDDKSYHVTKYFDIFQAICEYHLQEFEESTCVVNVASRTPCQKLE